MSDLSFFNQLKTLSFKHGFSQASGVDLEDPAFIEIHQKHFQQYKQWLQLDFSGDMQYLQRGVERRENHSLHLEEAESVFCVLESYSTTTSKQGPRIARYISGSDYHDRVSQKLELLMKEAKNLWPALKYKVCVDTSAVMERTLSYASGLGWIGKNTMLLNKEFGSFFFIGVVFLNHKLNLAARPQANLCGHCDRCLKQCPTQAFVEEQILDSRKCISYLTLEKRGPIPPSDYKALGPWIAGCDVCQEVCPFNHKRMAYETGDLDQPTFSSWLEALAISKEAYELKTKHSAMNRIKYENHERNVALSLTALKLENNLNTKEIQQSLKQLKEKKDKATEQRWRDFWNEIVQFWEA